MEFDTTKCYFTDADCLQATEIYSLYGGAYNSPLCGQYKFFGVDDALVGRFDKHKTACYLFYHKVTGDKCYLLVPLEQVESAKASISKCNANYNILTDQDIENWYPKTFAEKIDKSLIYIESQSKYAGHPVELEKNQISLIFFMSNKPDDDMWEWEFSYILKYYISARFMDGVDEENVLDIVENFDDIENPCLVTLTPTALQKIYELQKTQSNNKNVFVAMSFHKSADNIREALKAGITGAGYSAELMDEIIHNHQIVPEMLRLIKESKFLIMDITEPNFGAYYEAGYAQGLGKEVIVTCREDVFNTKDYKCEHKQDNGEDCRYKLVASKPHFDIAQKQILVWKDFDDLTRQLTEWIKFIIG